MSDGRNEIAEYPLEDAPVRDGIGEEDNPIPLWFNVTFYGSIVFGILYTIYYLFSGWSSAGQYAQEVARFEQQYASVQVEMPSENPYHGDATAIAEGKETFQTICAACHKPDGTGLVGPSLVDPYWKYGSDDAALYQSVDAGRPGGMPGWGAQLSEDEIWKTLAYMESLPQSDEPGVGAPVAGAQGG